MSTRREFVMTSTLAGLGIWFDRRKKRVKAALAKYGTAKYGTAKYGRR